MRIFQLSKKFNLMIIKKTKIAGVKIFKSEKYLDKRGYFSEVFKK